MASSGKEKIAALKEKAKSVKQEKEIKFSFLLDPFENASRHMNTKIGSTGFIYDEVMKEHHNIWDANYPENPVRLSSIFERCTELGLIDRCNILQSREATKVEILKKHSLNSFDQLKEVDEDTDKEKLLRISKRYDTIYVHPKTFKGASLAAGCCIELVDNILTNKIQNGFALVRPPGHHAMEDSYSGYCFFNNVALAATHALDNHNLRRILIVDFDVHHGRATQQMFFKDPRVVYFSIHRFENGSFWPNLRESDFDAIGFGAGAGYNFNVPLNKVGMGDTDYLAILHQVLLPMAYEFNPELILVSAGFDSAVGCAEGEMEVTPSCYAHLIGSLMPLAMGKIAVILEGGSYIKSLSESAALCVRALLGDPAPRLRSLGCPSLSASISIMDTIYTHKNIWNCYRFFQTYDPDTINSQGDNEDSRHVVNNVFYGITEESVVATEYPVVDCYPVQDQDDLNKADTILRQLQTTTDLSKPEHRVGFVYDERMLKHQNIFSVHAESPNRIKGIYDKLESIGILSRCVEIKSRLITNEEISMVHSRDVLDKLSKLDSMEKTEIQVLQKEYKSVYFCKDTIECAKVAAGSVLEAIRNVVEGYCRSGVCIVRPPGHHAEPDQPCGFCILNNIALGAKYALNSLNVQKVLIFDWDIHHGNGTQRMFLDNPNVLYISIHRYDNGKFFPNSPDANYDIVGTGSGEGFNINIPWNKKGMGDAEYLAAFHQIVIPIAYEFNPDLVLVSAGFDSAIGDPLGGCKLSPETFGHMTHYLSLLSKGKIVLVLEGGYNIQTISHCMSMCVKALLGDPLPPVEISAPIDQSAQETIIQVLKMHIDYWYILTYRLISIPMSYQYQSEYFNKEIFKDNYDISTWKRANAALVGNIPELEFGNSDGESSIGNEVENLSEQLSCLNLENENNRN